LLGDCAGGGVRTGSSGAWRAFADVGLRRRRRARAGVESNQREFYADPAVDGRHLRASICRCSGEGVRRERRLEFAAPWSPDGITAALVCRETQRPENLEPASLATFVLCLGTVGSIGSCATFVSDLPLRALPFEP
jgi:hypothetical protein